MARQIPPPPSGRQDGAPGIPQQPQYAPPRYAPPQQPQPQQQAQQQAQPQQQSAPQSAQTPQAKPPQVPQEQWDEYLRQLQDYEQQLREYEEAQRARAAQAQPAQPTSAQPQAAQSAQAAPQSAQPQQAPAPRPAVSHSAVPGDAPAVADAAPHPDLDDKTETAVRPGAWVLNAGEQRFPLRARNLLGRRPMAGENDGQAALIVLNDPERTLSKTHARIEIDPEGVWITDLGSTNGTALTFSTDTGLSRQTCEPGEDYEIKPGDTITLGAVEVTIEAGA